MLSQELLSCCAFAGILSHQCYFISGEHHLKAPIVARLSLFLPFAVAALLVRYGGLRAQIAIMNSLLLMTAYFSGLFASMLIYRAFFHRLNQFPGSPFAELSKLWHVSKITRLDNYRQMDDLYK